jgi:hypothetical protein
MPEHVHGQTARIRVEPASMASPLVTAPRVRATERRNLATSGIPRSGAITRGTLIGGTIGLVVSAVATVLYVESTDGSNYTGPMLGLVVGTTAVGALVGAAIGARSDAPENASNTR